MIAVAKKMGLPGFGENAIADLEGNRYPLHRTEDYFLRAAANIAFAGEKPAPDASEQDLLLTGVQRIMPKIEQTLKAEERLKVANVYCKGGRFAHTKVRGKRRIWSSSGKTACKFGTKTCIKPSTTATVNTIGAALVICRHVLRTAPRWSSTIRSRNGALN